MLHDLGLDCWPSASACLTGEHTSASSAARDGHGASVTDRPADFWESSSAITDLPMRNTQEASKELQEALEESEIHCS